MIAVVTTTSRVLERHDNRVGPGHDQEVFMKYVAGLDVSLDETAICVVDEDGIVVTEGKAASEPDDLVRWLVATGLTITRVGLEAGPLSPRLHTELRAAGLPAICIETRRMKGATAAMAVKTDRNDARAIAHAMRVGWFTVVHVKTAESQELRLLLNNRRTPLAQSPWRPSRCECWNCSPKDRGCWPWFAQCSPLVPLGDSNAMCCTGWYSRPCEQVRCAGACSPCPVSARSSR